MKRVRFSRAAYQMLCTTVGKAVPEAGAILGWDGTCVTKVWFDESAGVGKPMYRPSCPEVECAVNGWLQSGLQFAGLVHSHVAQYPQLSPMDLRSAIYIMDENKLTYMLMGLFCGGRLKMYALKRMMPGEQPELAEVALEVI